MTKRWLAYLIYLVAAVTFYGFYDGYLSYLLLLIVALFPFLSLLLSIPSFFGVSLELTNLPAEIYIGQGTDVFVDITRKRRAFLPIPRLELKYQNNNITFPEDEGSNGTVTHLTLYGCGDDRIPIEVNASHVGCLTIAFLSVKIYDFLGLFSIKLTPPEKRSVFIFPHAITPVPFPHFPHDSTITRGLKPLVGGGFSEEHELRNYRIGDPLNSIHWKLSSKLDDIIVREPLFSERGKILVCFNLFGTPDEMDNVFGQITYIAKILSGRMAEFSLCYYDADEELIIVSIENYDDYKKALCNIFRKPIPETGKPINKRAVKDAAWYCIIRPTEDARSDDDGSEEEAV